MLRQRRITVLILLSVVGVLAALPIHAAENDTLWHSRLENWELIFNPQNQELHCKHLPSEQTLIGVIGFTADRGKGVEQWRFVTARDGFEDRLAVLDKSGDVQAFLNCYVDGGRLMLHPQLRTPHNFQAQFRFTGSFSAEVDSFTCRSNQPETGRVVQMASGHANSTLNDSVFSPALDRLIQFDAANVSLKTIAKTTPEFQFSCEVALRDPGRHRIGITLEEDYYQERYVPEYRLLDRERCPKAPTGWMSWNTYFDTATAEDNLAEARIAQQLLQPFGMEIWHIESWQDNSDKLPVSTFSNLNLLPNPRQFPQGMKWLAEEIKTLGFKPGIWTVPFGTGNQVFYEAHKDWFLHQTDGTPMRNWCGKYLLDPSQEVVRDHMRETHRIMSEDWGYEYFKIDGMSGRNKSYSAHFFERDEVRAAFKDPTCEAPFRQCLQALRDGIGPDRIWLACQGHYTGPEIAFCDAGRLGADIVHANKPPGWSNYYNQAQISLNQLFVNNIVWYNDPDTLMLTTANPLDMVRLAATVVSLPGQMMFSGDKLAELPPERMHLLQQCLPVLNVQPRDLYPIFDMLPVWDLKIRRDFGSWDVVSLFNWKNEAATVAVTFEELGLHADQPYLVYDIWNQKITSDATGFKADLPPHANALFTVHPLQDHPQLIASDRHLSQGGVDIKDLRWDATTKTLHGRTTLVAGFPTRLTFNVPEPYKLQKVTTPEHVENYLITGVTPVQIHLLSGQSADTEWSLQFEG